MIEYSFAHPVIGENSIVAIRFTTKEISHETERHIKR